MVLEPFRILVPTPCDNLPISFVFAMFHSCPSLPFRRAESSSMQPVVGLTAMLLNRELLVVVLVRCYGSCVLYLASIAARSWRWHVVARWLCVAPMVASSVA